jgi:hypothetical protein
MSLLPVGLGAGDAGYEIEKSLRFRASASAYLSRTPGTAGSRTTWTYSVWFKRARTGANDCLLMAGAAASDFVYIDVSNTNRVRWQVQKSSSQYLNLQSSAVLRDPSAWYHLMFVYDAPNATQSERARMFLNGQRITSFSINTNALGLSETAEVNNTALHRISSNTLAVSDNIDGYLFEINFIDGQALAPSSFGEADSNGVWVAKKYTGTYGTNGFYLPFDDGTNLTNLCLDRSGNANNWTATNVSLTAGATYDWMDDTPTNNFAVLNPLLVGTSALSNANLTSAGSTVAPTILPDSGTWYLERDDSSLTWTPPAAFPAAAGAYNFGQRPFTNSPTHPTLCTKNLPAPAIAKPSDHFDAVLATGANIKTIAEGLYTHQLAWIKDRANSNNHQLIDSVRGTSAVLQSNTTAAETTYTAPSGSSVGWVWAVPDAGVTNTAGTITSTVSANTTAGFSVVTYTGTGANATVGHGLGVAPKMVVVKRRNSTSAWPTQHADIVAANSLYLNTTAASAAVTTVWNSTKPTSTLFSIGTSTDVNANTGTYVAYAFAEIPGFSRIGSYTGNGQLAGPFVYCGFRPRFVLIKGSSAEGNNWVVYDSSRDAHNVCKLDILANANDVEDRFSSDIDVLSNGFKLRGTSGDGNANGGTYIFIAFAEHPFNSARAR